MALVFQLSAQLAQTTAHPFLLPQGITTRLSFNQTSQGLLYIRILFFNQGTTTAFQPHPMEGTTFQLPLQLPTSPSNRLHVHAGDLRQQTITPMADSLGFQSHVPTSLLLVQTAEEQVHSSMQFPLWMFSQLLAVGTFALVYLCHPHFPSPLVAKMFWSILHQVFYNMRSWFWPPS